MCSFSMYLRSIVAPIVVTVLVSAAALRRKSLFRCERRLELAMSTLRPEAFAGAIQHFAIRFLEIVSERLAFWIVRKAHSDNSDPRHVLASVLEVQDDPSAGECSA